VIEQVGKNLAVIEEEKGYTFSLDKSNYMVIKTGKKSVENLEIKVKRGKLERVGSYKFLGNWINEEGTMDTQVENIEKKIEGVIKAVCRIDKKI